MIHHDHNMNMCQGYQKGTTTHLNHEHAFKHHKHVTTGAGLQRKASAWPYARNFSCKWGGGEAEKTERAQQNKSISKCEASLGC